MQTVVIEPQELSCATPMNNRETSDHYRHVIASYGKYRVITCRDDLQWILQRRRGQMRADGMYWHGWAYCTTRSALIRRCRALSGHMWHELEALPTNFRRGGLS